METVDKLKLDYKTDQAMTNLKDKMTKWFEIFLTPYQAKDLTPYMHAMYHHVPKFLKLYGNLKYNQQGMYNDIASKDYFRSSNHQGVSVIKQIFLKNKVFSTLKVQAVKEGLANSRGSWVVSKKSWVLKKVLIFYALKI